MENGLILVLDGMGGHLAGEVASRLAMETISSFYGMYAANRVKDRESLPRLKAFRDYWRKQQRQ